MVPARTKTLYVKDADSGVWEAAERIAGESISNLVAQLLRKYVAESQAARAKKKTKRINVTLREGDGPVVRKVFSGRLLLDGFETESQESLDHGPIFSVAYTARGRYAVWVGFSREEAGWFDYYPTLSELRRQVPCDVAAEVATAMGKEVVEELDI